MFMRILQLKVKPDVSEQFNNFYDNTIIPELQGLPGCLYAGLNQSGPNPEEYISITFWNSHESAEDYEKSGTYQKLVEKGRPYLAESTEWKIQLSEKLELEYKPVPEEPIAKEYSVEAQTDSDQPMSGQDSKMYVRIVSHKIEEGKIDDFKNLYSSEIIPVLKLTKGCRHAYLTENMEEKNELISVTVWDTKEDADNYEASGRFDELINRVKHTFSKLYQWKMALEKDMSKRVKTSEDLSVSRYKMVTGKTFQK